MDHVFDDEEVFSNMHLHTVWSTKEQQPILGESWTKHLKNFISELVMDYDCRLIAARMAADHIHLLIKFTPDTATNDLIINIKSSTAVWIRTNIPELKVFEWQKSDCAFTISQEEVESMIIQFRELEKTPFVEEIFPLLDANGISYTKEEVLE
jgi:putative transposase